MAEVQDCPNQQVLSVFKHQLAYEKTQESYELEGLSVIHMNVWLTDSVSAFYIRDRLKGFIPGERMTYVFSDGLIGGGTCPVAQDWKECLQRFVDVATPPRTSQICSITIDTRRIPPWTPSPNDEVKKQIAEELKQEIETSFEGAEEIVIRDFNLLDPQITAYIKMPDGDYFQGCGFHSTSKPHCVWHLFGQAPISQIRSRIVARPYRLK
jgi:hypothetical protein